MFFTPKNFLKVGGIVLVLVGVLGFIGIIGPTAGQSIFGSFWWFDNGENWAHLVLGVVALVAAFAFPANTHKPIVILVGLLAIFFVLYNFFSTSFAGSNLESPADLVLHLIVGAWALYSGLNKKSAM